MVPSVPVALIDRIAHLPAAGDRVLLGIAGSPGSGKTTLARALADHWNTAEPGLAAHLPMDGFHLANATLDRLGRRDRKGAIDTFDGAGFVALLARLRAERGDTVYAPSFERAIEEPIAGEIAIESAVRLVVVEGNYLLADAPPWDRVRGLLDEVWFCATPEPERIRRLVERHTRGGRTPAQALAWALEVDGVNALGIEASRRRADLVVSGETGEIIG